MRLAIEQALANNEATYDWNGESVLVIDFTSNERQSIAALHS